MLKRREFPGGFIGKYTTPTSLPVGYPLSVFYKKLDLMFCLLQLNSLRMQGQASPQKSRLFLPTSGSAIINRWAMVRGSLLGHQVGFPKKRKEKRQSSATLGPSQIFRPKET